MSKPVAVFDIDGTMFRSSLLTELVDELIRRDIFSPAMRKSYAKTEENWKFHGKGYDAYITKVVEAFRKNAKGIPYGDIADVAGEIIEAQKDNVYTYTRELAKDLKSRGYFLLAISRSPKFIVDGFGYELGFDKTYGIFYDTGATSRFTGEIVDEHLIMNKGLVLQRAVKRNGLTFKGSYAIGGTESDIPMLELADTAIAFNPSKALLRRAKQHHWKVVLESKDAVYEL